MKKLFAILISFLFIGVVHAENCIIQTGDGTKIGDEVKCGTESFYVIDHDEHQTKLLTKYNLYVGDNINWIDVGEDAPKNDGNDDPTIYYNTMLSYCENLATSKGYNPYFIYLAYAGPNSTMYDIVGCRIYEKIEYDHIRQDSKAIATTFNSEGKSNYPQYGITYMNPEWGYDAIHDDIYYDNIYEGTPSLEEFCGDNPTNACQNEYFDVVSKITGNLKIEGSSFEKYFTGYKEELESQNIDVKDISFITLDGFKKLYKSITNEDLQVGFNWEHYTSEYVDIDADYYYSGKLHLIDTIPEKYSWLYATTFWLGSGSMWDAEIPNTSGTQTFPSEYNDYYFTTEGILCSLGRGICVLTGMPIGGGLRPVITVDNSIVKSASSSIGEQVEQKPNPKTGDIAILTITLFALASAFILLTQKKKLDFLK